MAKLVLSLVIKTPENEHETPKHIFAAQESNSSILKPFFLSKKM